MTIIEVLNRNYDRQRNAFVDVVEARLGIDAGGLVVLDGDPEWRHLGETVLDHPGDPGRNLELADDPELWAATLPEAFRAGGLSVVVHTRGDDARRHAVGDVISVATAAGQAA